MTPYLFSVTIDEYNAYCRSLPSADYANQWGGAHVWKVGGKMFAIGIDRVEGTQFTFKVSEIGFEIMHNMDGLRPAPYLASRGMKWIQHYEQPGLNDEDLKDHIQSSYKMAIKRMTKKARVEMGL